MSSQYSRILSIDNRYWNENCPIVLEKGALLYDSMNQYNILQFQFYSIGDKSIRGFKLYVDEYDISKKRSASDEFQYVDINISKLQKFGQNIPCIVSDTNARYFDFTIKDIAYMDGEIDNNEYQLDVIEAPKKIETLGKLKEAFCVGLKDVSFYPVKKNTYWICVCGEINRGTKCIRCGQQEEEIFLHADSEYLNRKNEELVHAEQERAKKAEFEKLKEDLDKQNKQDKLAKFLKIFIPAVAVVGIVVFLIIKFYVLPTSYRKNATTLFESGDYTGAIEYWSKAGDNPEEILLDKAEAAFEMDNYPECEAILSAIGETTKNTFIDNHRQDYYSKAEVLLEDGKYEESLTVLSYVGEDAKQVFLRNHVDGLIENGIQQIYDGDFSKGKQVIDFSLTNIEESDIGDDNFFNIGVAMLEAGKVTEYYTYTGYVENMESTVSKHAIEVFEKGCEQLNNDNISAAKELFSLVYENEDFILSNKSLIDSAFTTIDDLEKLDVLDYYFDSEAGDVAISDLSYAAALKSVEERNAKEAVKAYGKIIDETKKDDIYEKLHLLAIDLYNSLDYKGAEVIFSSIDYDDKDKYMTAIDLWECIDLGKINMSEFEMYLGSSGEVQQLLSSYTTTVFESAKDQLQKAQGCFTGGRPYYILVKGHNAYFGDETAVMVERLVYDIDANSWTMCWGSGSYVEATFEIINDEWHGVHHYVRTSANKLPGTFNQYK